MGFIRLIHAWAGAVVALVLVVLGLTGSLLVLKEDWIRLTTPQARAEAATTPQALGAAAEALERARPGEIRTIAFAGPHLGVHKLYFREAETEGYASADGLVLAEWTGPTRAEAFVFDLHHYLLAGERGMILAGVVALAGAVLAITGLIVWFPAWRSFAWRMWPRSGRRRELLGSHRDLGIVFAAPVFVFCLTGGAIIFHEETRAILQAMFPHEPEEVFAPPPGAGDVDWPRALAAAQAAFPDAQLRMASFPAQPGDPVSIRMKLPAEWHPNGRTVVKIDPATSSVLEATSAQSLGTAARISNAIYPIHAAFVGGRVYDLVTFLSGLALAAMGGFGLWSFVVKPRKRRVRIDDRLRPGPAEVH
jgi:uncharacterized iron-regulated membrane protein